MGLNIHSELVLLVRREAAIDMVPVLELGVVTVIGAEVAADNRGQVEEEIDIRSVLAVGGTCQVTGRIQVLAVGLGMVVESTLDQDMDQARDKRHTKVVARSQG